MSIPQDRKYTEHDEWILVDGDVATVGLSDYAQDALGELVYVEMPEVGVTVEAGASVAEVESVKAVAEVYAPVTGEIVEINAAIDGNEGIVNSDPYGEGWLFRIRLSDASQLDALLDAEAYTSKVNG